MTGNAFIICRPYEAPPVTKPCLPSPCGPNSVCREVNDQAVCTCVPGYFGSPPSCRPECLVNSDCPQARSCINMHCSDPCPGTCGIGAECMVINHNPICKCSNGMTGDPFVRCYPIPQAAPIPELPRNPCLPSPCGPNSVCQPINQSPSCTPLLDSIISESDFIWSLNLSFFKDYLSIYYIICINGLHEYTGNAFTACHPLPPPPPVATDPCRPSPCGPNTRCTSIQGVANCECLPGFQGSPSSSGGCRPECVISSDCPRNKACINNKCGDPCVGVCGYLATCHVVNHSPICSCPPKYHGDPFVECQQIPAPPSDPCNPSPCGQNGQCRVVNGVASCVYPECVINQDCPRDKTCYNQKCKDPCFGACGINAICQAVNHRAVCSCPPNYFGDARIQCNIQRDPVVIPKPECTSDNDCSNDRACINEKCADPCQAASTSLCAYNAECRVLMHRPVCVCREGLTGNGLSQCFDIGCRSDSECPPTEACVNKECVNPCRYTQCGLGAECHVVSNSARCVCPQGTLGDPQVSCLRPQCTSDSECPSYLACRNTRCADPCDCAPGALCTVQGHVPTCRCPPGYIGNPHVSCTIEPQMDTGCKQDADCASKLACFSGECRNPCYETKPCGQNAECFVVDTLPLRTMSCQCLPGFLGDADVRCDRAPLSEPGCSTDSECSSAETCVNRQCVNPCSISNPCAKNAECQPTNHKAVCRCPAGLVGDPFTNCYRVPTGASPECTSDWDCPLEQVCINQRCQDPCRVNQPCGKGAECTTLNHRPTCACPLGWAGNPETSCYRPECRVNSDCIYEKACISGNCVSPCSGIKCGRGAECRVTQHIAQCVCPPGTQGDAHLSCVSVGCQYNEDCADHEACDRLNHVCRPVCERDTCGRRAACTAKAHQPVCTCDFNTQGDPYVECNEIRQTPRPECTQDSDCGSKQACMNKRCQNPCTLPAVCAPDQECRVQDTLPLRTVICQCPPDTIAATDGHCTPIRVEEGRTECKVDDDCRDPDRCVRGSCVDACKIDPCGLNAQCQSTRHQAQCSCAPGFIGNPYIECSYDQAPPPPVAECSHNDDCPVDKKCHNQLCVNPCSVGSPCAPGSFCFTNDHKPVCRCPPGFTGDPFTKCYPPTADVVGCESNSECPSQEACVNRMCVSPCNCGPNAECRVQDHYPICFCKPGYSGNPQIGCEKIGCETDSMCSSDKTCYNGECINPCIIGDPCGTNAECYGANHRAQCRCYPGYQGNANIRCDHVECNVDADCPSSRTCLEHRCINPCTDLVQPPCASNAICFVRNHIAGCRCPESEPLGNPMSYCHRLPPPRPNAPECEHDVDCPSKQACIKNSCRNPCDELAPCSQSAMCSVSDTVPVRTMVCTCPTGWAPDEAGECKPVVVPTPPGCSSDSECSFNETCINRMCRNPCNCGPNAECHVNDHRPVCSCIPGFDGNPDLGCRAVGCRTESECGSGKACINGHCINPCVVEDPCGPNAECFAIGSRAECRCVSGYQGNPYERCNIIGCRSNSDCPSNRACINAQCINPCVYEHPCAPQAECTVQNHLALCKCPPSLEGNPYTACRARIEPECTEDGDCPSLLACFNGHCKNPCTELEPCQRPAMCQTVSTLPVRTMICECPPGYISSGSGTCKATPPVKTIGECIDDSECPTDRACINAICRDPCDCGPNSECRIKDHKPICSCLPGYDGNPNLECVKIGCRHDSDCSSQHACLNRQCVPVCSPDGSSCGTGAVCYGSNHHALCSCPPGMTGNPQVGCVHVQCEANSDCPSNKACVNTKCISPCEEHNPCSSPAECTVFNHFADCSCPPGYIGNNVGGCKEIERGCESDSDCPLQTACINKQCVNPCVSNPCGTNTLCQVFDTTPVRTMACVCLPGYYGNAAVECIKVSECPPDKGFVRDSDGNCVCPPGTALNPNDECVRCLPQLGYKIDERGHCVCDLEKGLIIDERGNCKCPTDHGYILDVNGYCKPVFRECEVDSDCADHLYCNTETKTCVDPCEEKLCVPNAFCNATRHIAVCQCISGYNKNSNGSCIPPNQTHMRTDFPRPDMVVSCLSDGVQVEIHIEEKGFNGVLYVKGHSKDERCRRVVSLPTDSQPRTEIFKVNFGTCGLIHVNGQASFVLVIQKHPMLVTFKTQAYHIKCVYTTGEQNVTLGFNVSMLTTAGTIANTGPPPTCLMRIVTNNGQEINSAEIGDNLMLQVDVQPSSIYGGFARSCVAKTMEDAVENEYIVTDENGCATDPSIFGEWDYNPDTQSLLANFNAFKFPSSDNIRFQCNIRVCFGKCQPVNCRGYNAFGRRRRSLDDGTRNGSGSEVAETSIGEGQLREEITIESNAILTFERREERYTDSSEGSSAPQLQQMDDICVSMIGFIIALIITALLALVAVAVAVSCWLLAYRRRPKTSGPLPHPPDFPNPLFTTPEPLAEPSPDYLS
ncbi:PTI [Nesidiocoris tenuis]|uniref:PTI n=1 Tax=Nesidiocoris tenuis TaxID=355587 RepID=A0ABN7AYA1_9HEMI|nr:PTI [Nesidiocoris tenuis]